MSKHSGKVSSAIKLGSPILKFLSAFILLIRGTGEEMGEGVSERFIKDRHTEAESKKIKSFGKKTGGFVSVVATFGVFGTYIVDISKIDDIAENENHHTDEKTDVAGVDRCNEKEEIDINNKDGKPDGYDTTGDNIIDHNLNCDPVGDLVNVSGYTREDGTHVDAYRRTEADGTTKNNIRV